MTERKTRHESTTPRLSRDSLHLAKEVRSIQRRAAEHDGRIVTIGPLVFFSTDTGDAWMLEPADQLAARLAAFKFQICLARLSRQRTYIAARCKVAKAAI